MTDLTERARIEGELKVVGQERRLPPDVELTIFRIAQEALRNAERHARATQVAVTLTFIGGKTRKARLHVADNGTGFTLPVAGDFAASGHLGLLGMRERAESLGGKLRIQSSPGNGTRVSISISEEVGVAEDSEKAAAIRSHGGLHAR